MCRGRRLRFAFFRAARHLHLHDLLADVTDKVVHHSVGNVVSVAERPHRHPARHPLTLVLHIEPPQVFAAVHWSRLAKVRGFSPGPKFDH